MIHSDESHRSSFHQFPIRSCTRGVASTSRNYEAINHREAGKLVATQCLHSHTCTQQSTKIIWLKYTVISIHLSSLFQYYFIRLHCSVQISVGSYKHKALLKLKEKQEPEVLYVSPSFKNEFHAPDRRPLY